MASFEIFCRIVSVLRYAWEMSCSDEFADLLQVLSILTMERPVSFAPEDIRDEKVQVHRE